MKTPRQRSGDGPPKIVEGLDLPLAAHSKTTSAITEQLRAAILSGHYGFGDRLPPERDLAVHFKVSRTTVRDALNELEKSSLVVRKVGSGTFANYRADPEDHLISERTSPLEVIEARLAIEPHMARLAVLNATERDIQKIEQALNELLASGTDKQAFTLADEAFHLALAEASRNPLLVWLYRRINEVRNHAQWSAMRDLILTPDRLDDYNRQHREIFDALRIRDADSAAAIITSHLVRARRHLIGAAEGEE